MCLQVQNQECGHLARAVESGLASAERFVEFSPAGSTEVAYLGRGEAGDFAAATGVGRGCLEG